MKQLKKHKKYAKIILLKCRGGIAQLVERLNGIQEVAGSIPTISTTLKIHSFRCVFFVFIDSKKKATAMVTFLHVKYFLPYAFHITRFF